MVRPVTGTHRKWVTPRDRPLIVLHHGWALLRREGLTGVVSGAGRFLRALLHSVYSESELRLYHLPIAEAAAIPVKAPMENLHLRIVESRGDALKLVAEGFDNILEAAPGAERKLSHGAVAACAFLGHELASIDWMALSDGAKLVVDRTPYPVDCAAGESCTGGAFTLRRLRGRGIAAYRFSAQVAYLHSMGRRTCYNAIAADNVPSRRTVERYGATFDAVFRRRSLLGRTSYKQVWARTEATPEAPGLRGPD